LTIQIIIPSAALPEKANTLKNVTLSMGGGSTLDWLAKLPQDAQGGGFFTRVVIVHEEASKPPKAMPDRKKAELGAKVQGGWRI